MRGPVIVRAAVLAGDSDRGKARLHSVQVASRHGNVINYQTGRSGCRVAWLNTGYHNAVADTTGWVAGPSMERGFPSCSIVAEFIPPPRRRPP